MLERKDYAEDTDLLRDVGGREMETDTDLDGALVHFERCLSIERRNDVVASTRRMADICTTQTQMGVVYSRQGRLDDALYMFGEAQRIYERVYGTEHEAFADTVYRSAEVPVH